MVWSRGYEFAFLLFCERTRLRELFDLEVAWAVDETLPVTPCRWFELFLVWLLLLDFVLCCCIRSYCVVVLPVRVETTPPLCYPILLFPFRSPPLIVLIMLLVRVKVVPLRVRVVF